MTEPIEVAGEDLTGHVRESVDAIASLHRDHYKGASSLQKAIDGATDRLGQPAFLAMIFLVFASWIATAFVSTQGRIEQPAFVWIELTATLAALFIALLILVTQRRQDQLAERREQLTLELAILADRKIAKVIALVEELRRDAPDLADRHDPESTEMAAPTDPKKVMAAIDRETESSRRRDQP